jgi:hypothetical protein
MVECMAAKKEPLSQRRHCEINSGTCKLRSTSIAPELHSTDLVRNISHGVGRLDVVQNPRSPTFQDQLSTQYLERYQPDVILFNFTLTRCFPFRAIISPPTFELLSGDGRLGSTKGVEEAGM